ncbi:hypothetical protein HYFRA_00011039 [Hymenoscyphus fraxineus]|uniref:Rhodopsin domain-containing protein n=1 Tax=Hymenoscyphus fraxineus TaxID=746836 RepID=A0A9N9L7E6_9HELO|nr:hypothetical protein HYFRA_00011039 [Hymenoscyphus fraxineus]
MLGEGDRYAITIAMGILMAILATTAVLARFEARRITHLGYKTDDYTIVAALICLIGMSICNLIGAFAGRMGTHESIRPTASPETEAEWALLRSKLIWALQILNILGPGLTRTSILFFYRRIFVGRPFKTVTCFFIVLNMMWTIAFFFGNLLGCYPTIGNWQPGVSSKGICINFDAFYKSMVVTDVVLDGLVLLLPWYPIWHLNMPTRQKITVSAIFLLGTFVCISGIFRIIAMFDALGDVKDRTY